MSIKNQEYRSQKNLILQRNYLRNQTPITKHNWTWEIQRSLFYTWLSNYSSTPLCNRGHCLFRRYPSYSQFKQEVCPVTKRNSKTRCNWSKKSVWKRCGVGQSVTVVMVSLPRDRGWGYGFSRLFLKTNRSKVFLPYTPSVLLSIHVVSSLSYTYQYEERKESSPPYTILT